MPRKAFDLELQTEILNEQALSLGRCAKKLEETLRALAGANDENRDELIDICAERAWFYVVQREAMGLSGSYAALDVYRVPTVVKARIGPRRATRR